MLIQFGHKGDIVNQIQEVLGLPISGLYDRITESAVKNFQNKNELIPTGKCDDETLHKLLDFGVSTDNMEKHILMPEKTLGIEKYFLPSGEYKEQQTKKEYLFLHHTAGWNNPYKQVDDWAKDNRGPIGTHFIIGGPNPLTNDKKYDGITLQCFSEDNWAYHLGKVDAHMHSHSIGIEICNFGYLVRKSDGFYNYVNKKIDSRQVIDLGFHFRGYQYWHSYSDAQIESAKRLLLYLSEKHQIDLQSGLKQWINEMGVEKAFDYFLDARNGQVKGLLSHSNVRTDKFDIYPHPKMVEMIMSLD